MKTHEEIENKINYLMVNESLLADQTEEKEHEIAHRYAYTLLAIFRNWLSEDEENAPSKPL